MARTLFLELRHGISPERLAGALVDMGVAPSPLLFAAASLGLPASLDFERTPQGVVTRVQGDGDVAAFTLDASQARVERAGIPAAAVDLASRALLALYEAHAEASGVPVSEVRLPLSGPEESLPGLVAASLAVAQLAPERVLATRVDVGDGTTVYNGQEVEVPSPPLVALLAPVAHSLAFTEGAGALTTGTGAALLRALVPAGQWGVDEPAWAGYVSRGRGIPLRAGTGPLSVAFGEAP